MNVLNLSLQRRAYLSIFYHLIIECTRGASILSQDTTVGMYHRIHSERKFNRFEKRSCARVFSILDFSWSQYPRLSTTAIKYMLPNGGSYLFQLQNGTVDEEFVYPFRAAF